jgi:hypothetical protein
LGQCGALALDESGRLIAQIDKIVAKADADALRRRTKLKCYCRTHVIQKPSWLMVLQIGSLSRVALSISC